MSLLAELKRRNVIRMAGVYLVGAWLVVGCVLDAPALNVQSKSRCVQDAPYG